MDQHVPACALDTEIVPEAGGYDRILTALLRLPSASVHSVITDPPGALRFLANAEDYGMPVAAVWREIARVCKPGAHVVCLAHVATMDLQGMILRMAGFEVRDCIRHEQGHGAAERWRPIIVARKPLDGTVAENVLRHGCGVVNVDGCRVVISAGDDIHGKNPHTNNKASGWVVSGSEGAPYAVPPGRFPANLTHDNSAEVLAAFAAFGETKSQGGAQHNGFRTDKNIFLWPGGRCGMALDIPRFSDAGTAARFFAAVPDTVALRTYLTMLVTPEGGITLDPFAQGSAIPNS